MDKNKCNHCGSCVSNCKMDVMEVGDHECIQCGQCIAVCNKKAIDWKLISKKVKEEIALEHKPKELAEANKASLNNEEMR